MNWELWLIIGKSEFHVILYQAGMIRLDVGRCTEVVTVIAEKKHKRVAIIEERIWQGWVGYLPPFRRR